MLHPRCELGVELQLVGFVRLLDHQQFELVERREQVGVFGPIARVRVDLQREIADALLERPAAARRPSRA